MTEAEILQVLESPTDSTPYTQQRCNILKLMYSTGWRAESIVRLKVGSLKKEFLPDGRQTFQIIIGTMKNVQGGLSNMDRQMVSTLIVQHENPKLCAINAIHCQHKLVGEDADPKDFLFRLFYTPIPCQSL